MVRRGPRPTTGAGDRPREEREDDRPDREPEDGDEVSGGGGSDVRVSTGGDPTDDVPTGLRDGLPPGGTADDGGNQPGGDDVTRTNSPPGSPAVGRSAPPTTGRRDTTSGQDPRFFTEPAETPPAEEQDSTGQPTSSMLDERSSTERTRRGRSGATGGLEDRLATSEDGVQLQGAGEAVALTQIVDRLEERGLERDEFNIVRSGSGGLEVNFTREGLAEQIEGVDTGDLTFAEDGARLTEQARRERAANSLEGELNADVNLTAEDVAREGDMWTLTDEGRADLRGASEEQVAQSVATRLDERVPGINVTTEDLTVRREFTTARGDQLTPRQLQSVEESGRSLTDLQVSVDADIQSEIARRRQERVAAQSPFELGAQPRGNVTIAEDPDALERSVRTRLLAVQQRGEGEDAVLTPTEVAEAEPDLERGSDVTSVAGGAGVMLTDTGGRNVRRRVVTESLEEQFGASIQPGRDFEITSSGRVRLTESFRRGIAERAVGAALSEEFDGEFDTGEEFNLAELPQGEIPGAPGDEQPQPQFTPLLTDEGRQQVAGTAETGENPFDRTVINEVLGADPQTTASASGVPVVFPAGFPGGEGDAVQQAEAYLEEQAAIHRSGEGLLPSGAEGAQFAQSGRSLDDEGSVAPPAAGPGIGAGPAAPTGFFDGLSKFTEGSFRRAGETANPAAVALGAGRLGESVGEFGFNLAAGAVAPEQEQRQTARQRAATQAATAGLALGTIATDTVGGLNERPVETAGSAFTEGGLLFASAAASPVRFGRASVPSRAAGEAADASTTLYRGLVLDAPPIVRRLGFSPDPQPVVGVTGRGPTVNTGTVNVTASAADDASTAQRLVTKTTSPELDVELPRVGTPDTDQLLSPALGTPDIDIQGPPLRAGAEGAAPSTPTETTLFKRNLRDQLEGDDLQALESVLTLRKLGGRVPITRRLARLLGFNRRATDIETGVRASQLIPDDAAGDVAEIIRENRVVFKGSANQLIQSGKARVPEDIDIARPRPDRTSLAPDDPLAVEKRLGELLGSDLDLRRSISDDVPTVDEQLAEALIQAADAPVRQTGGGLLIKTEDGFDHLVDIKDFEGATRGLKKWNIQIAKPERAPGGGLLQPLETQFGGKIQGGVRLFGDDTIAPQPFRAKDVLDIEAVGEELIERNKRSLNPLRQLRARRAESALEDFKEAFGDLDLPGGRNEPPLSTESFADLRSRFEMTEVDRPSPAATLQADVQAAFGEFAGDTRAQTTAAGALRSDPDTDTGDLRRADTVDGDSGDSTSLSDAEVVDVDRRLRRAAEDLREETDIDRSQPSRSSPDEIAGRSGPDIPIASPVSGGVASSLSRSGVPSGSGLSSVGRPGPVSDPTTSSDRRSVADPSAGAAGASGETSVSGPGGDARTSAPTNEIVSSGGPVSDVSVGVATEAGVPSPSESVSSSQPFGPGEPPSQPFEFPSGDGRKDRVEADLEIREIGENFRNSISGVADLRRAFSEDELTPSEELDREIFGEEDDFGLGLDSVGDDLQEDFNL